MPDFIRGTGPIEHVPLPRELRNFSTREMQERFYAREEASRGAPVRRPWEPENAWKERIAGWKPAKSKEPAPEYSMSPVVAEREYLRLERTLKGTDPKDAAEIVQRMNEYAAQCGRKPITVSQVSEYKNRLADTENEFAQFSAMNRWQDRIAKVEEMTSHELLSKVIVADTHNAVKTAAQARLAAVLAGVKA